MSFQFPVVSGICIVLYILVVFNICYLCIDFHLPYLLPFIEPAINHDETEETIEQMIWKLVIFVLHSFK